MSKMPTITEQELSNLQPTGLDEDFLARLTACADGTDLNITEGEAVFEAHLRALRPRPIPGTLKTSLLNALGDTPFALDEIIVLFNKPSSASVMYGKKLSAFRFNVAAAAVALLGSLTAFLIPEGIRKGQSAETGDATGFVPAPITNTPSQIKTAPSQIAPASISSHTRDEGVIWSDKNQPHRILRRIYMDQVLTKDAAGNFFPELRPRVEYVIIPDKID